MAERIELDAGKADVGEFDADDYTASASILDGNPDDDEIPYLSRGLTYEQYHYRHDEGGIAGTHRPMWAGGGVKNFQ